MVTLSPNPWRTIRLLAVSALESRPIAETLLGLRRSGIDLEVIAPGHAPYAGLLRESGCAMESTYPGLDHRVALLARRKLRQESFDILYAEGLSCPASIPLAAYGSPTRVAVRLCYLESQRRLSMSGRLSCRAPKVDRILSDVDPEAYGDSLTARWLEDKTVTLPLAHDPRWYPASLEFASFGVPAGAFSVAAVTDGPNQGMERLIDCARELPMDLPIHFLLVAPESAHERLRRLIRKIPFTQRFHLSDAVEAAPAIMACCSVFVVTAWEVEVQRRSCMHCLSSGVPVLAESVSPLDLVVRPGASGELLPPGDTQALAHTLFELYENPERRALLGAGAQRLAGELPSMDVLVASTAAVFERILSGERKQQ